MPQSFDICYVTSPSGTLLCLLKLWLCGQNDLILDVTEFTLTYKLKRTKSPVLKPLGLDPLYHPVDGPYLNLLQIDLFGQKWPHQGFTRAWSVFNRYIKVRGFKQNSGEQYRVTWRSFSVCQCLI